MISIEHLTFVWFEGGRKPITRSDKHTLFSPVEKSWGGEKREKESDAASHEMKLDVSAVGAQSSSPKQKREIRLSQSLSVCGEKGGLGRILRGKGGRKGRD